MKAAAQASAAAAVAASTVTDRTVAPCALRCDFVRTDPPHISTAPSERSVLSGSGMPTDRCVERVARPIQRNCSPKPSSALSTTGPSARAARSSAYPIATLSGGSATRLCLRTSSRTESSAAIRIRFRNNEAMRSTESRAASSACATRVLSAPPAPHAAADSVVPISGHAREMGGRGSRPQAAMSRLSAHDRAIAGSRLILKNDCRI